MLQQFPPVKPVFFSSGVKPAEPVKAACDLLLWKQLCQTAVSLHPEKRSTAGRYGGSEVPNATTTVKSKSFLGKWTKNGKNACFRLGLLCFFTAKNFKKLLLNILQLGSNLAGLL